MLSLMGVTAVYAVLPGGTTFEGNDGNLIHSGTNTDWDNVAGLHSGIDLASGSTDNSFGQGTKEDSSAVTVVTGSIPPNKNDLTRFYEASEHAGSSDYLYLAWERAVNIGNANLDFEINKLAQPNLATAGAKTLNRSAGDLLVTYDFGGSGTPTLGILRWLTSASVPVVPGFATNACFSANAFPCWGDRKVLDANEAEGAVNTGTVSDPIAPNAPRSLGTGLFGEAAINLTTAGVFTAGSCESFGSVFLKSRSSSSFPAEIKDFVAPISVHISNCGEVRITKDADIDDGTVFDYTTTNSLAADFTLLDGATKTITSVPTGTYSVSESAETGWTLDHITCTATGTGSSIGTTTNPTANFTVAADGLIECTFYNTKDKANPKADTAPSYNPQDSATVTGCESNGGTKGKIHFELWSTSTCTTASGGAKLYDEQQTVDANGPYTTANPGGSSLSGRTISTSTTVYWKVYYDGDTRNNGFNDGCSESIDATLTGFTAP